MKDFTVAPEIIEKIKNTPTEDLMNELILKKEWIEEEPYLAQDEEFCAIIKAIEAELASRGVSC